MLVSHSLGVKGQLRTSEMGVKILTCIQLSVKLNQQPLEI